MNNFLRKKKGSLLFETFIALAFLSIAITGILRVFSESFFVSRQNAERREINLGLSRLMFPWFANPGVVDFSEEERLQVPLDTGGENPDIWADIHSSLLSTEEESEDDSGDEKTKDEVKQVEINLKRQAPDYFQVRLEITKSRQKPLAEFETVLFKVDSENTAAANLVK